MAKLVEIIDDSHQKLSYPILNEKQCRFVRPLAPLSGYRYRNGADDRFWPIPSFRCAAEFGRYRAIADTDKPPTRQIYGFTA
jgi:hypothetical protein